MTEVYENEREQNNYSNASRSRSCFCRQNQKTLKNLNEYTPEYTVPENRERPKILVTLTNLTGLSILTEAFPRAIE